jgi:hypothetical protein
MKRCSLLIRMGSDEKGAALKCQRLLPWLCEFGTIELACA